jgi:hypothetical protein
MHGSEACGVNLSLFTYYGFGLIYNTNFGLINETKKMIKEKISHAIGGI